MSAYKKCLICDSKTCKIDFSVEKCITSDGKVCDIQLSHSYCKRCGYVFVDSQKIKYEDYYIHQYEFLLDDDEIEPVLGCVKYSDLLIEFFSDFLQDGTNKTFLDIGAGKGNFLQSLENKYPKIQKYAVEPNKYSYERLRNKNFLKEHYMGFFNSKIFKGKFDYISLIGVLEHVPDPKGFLIDVKNIMHDDSLLLIEVPNFENNKADLLTVDHLSKFTPHSILNLFSICGLEVVKERISESIPMQFIVKKRFSSFTEIRSPNSFDYIYTAISYLKKVDDDINKIYNKDDKIIVYGQGLILHYLVGTNKLKMENILCIIDDNPFYHNKLFKNKIPIMSFTDFKKSSLFSRIRKVFLAMNPCYYKNVINKLSGFEVLGL